MSNKPFRQKIYGSDISLLGFHGPEDSKGILTILPDGPGISSHYLISASQRLTEHFGVFLFEFPSGESRALWNYEGFVGQILTVYNTLFAEQYEIKAAIGHGFGAMLQTDIYVEIKELIPYWVFTSLPANLSQSMVYLEEKAKIMRELTNGLEPSFEQLLPISFCHPPSRENSELILKKYSSNAMLNVFNGFPRKKSIYLQETPSPFSEEFKVMLLQGANDRRLPENNFELLKKEFPNAQTNMIEECGHFPMLEKADEFDQAIKNFLIRKNLFGEM